MWTHWKGDDVTDVRYRTLTTKLFNQVFSDPYDRQAIAAFLKDPNYGVQFNPALLSATGGIVQGMSGSPILQNGRLVGAVTHVLVNDPTRGYGIFAQTMLEQAKNAVQNGAEAQTAE